MLGMQHFTLPSKLGLVVSWNLASATLLDVLMRGLSKLLERGQGSYCGFHLVLQKQNVVSLYRVFSFLYGTFLVYILCK